MSVTLRVVLAMAIATIAACAAILLLTEQAQTEAIEARIADAVTLAMTSGGRERCEADPERFVERSEARAERARGRGVRSERGRRLSPLVGARFGVFDAEGRGVGAARRLPSDLVERLDREGVALFDEGEGHARFLVRMPWDDGPCVIVGVERVLPEDMSAARRRGLVLSLVVLVVASLAAIFALRTPLARLRALTDASAVLGRSGFVDRAALDRASAQLGGDEVSGLAKSLRDAVDRIAADAARLSARDAALTEYVAHTTHDLMTPITVLTGHLAELEDDLSRGRAIERRTVERAIGEAHYLATLIANLGVVARLDRPDPIVQKRSIDLREVIERVAARHEPLARAKGLSLEHAVPDAPCTIDGDDLLLERALGNLVHNAIRHHKLRDGGEGHVALVLAVEDHGLTIRVVDDGTGLDDATLRSLVSSARGEGVAEAEDAVRTRRHGFGMDVVRRVASLHDFTLEVSRAEEGGLSVLLTRRPTVGQGTI